MGRPKYIFNFLMKFWPLAKMANRLGNRPVIGPWLRPLFSSAENESIIVPIREAVRSEESVVLPQTILAPLIQKADAHVLLNQCICRHAEHCQTFPQDVGCLFLGRGALQIHRAMGRPVSGEEALAHSERAVSLGLVPLVVHVSFDAFVLGIPYRRMLAVCFCCECCCSIRQGLRMGPRAFWDTVVRLPGLTVEVGEECVGCGNCVAVCHVGAIKVEYGRARVNDLCKGCGRCAEACPIGAIQLRLREDVNVVEDFLQRIERRTNIGQLNGRRR